jgi:hypothetical protein
MRSGWHFPGRADQPRHATFLALHLATFMGHLAELGPFFVFHLCLLQRMSGAVRAPNFRCLGNGGESLSSLF